MKNMDISPRFDGPPLLKVEVSPQIVVAVNSSVELFDKLDIFHRIRRK